MKEIRQLSPLLRFKAKSELADFSKPIDIPKRLEPLDLNTAEERAELTDSNVFVQRSEMRQWPDGADGAIKQLRASQLTDREIMEKYFIPEDDVERMEHLRELMCDNDDFFFGRDGIEHEDAEKTEMTSIFQNKENIDETEMHIMAFNEAIAAIAPEHPNTAGTLAQIRNYFIYKVKEKNRIHRSLEESAKELDQRCYEALEDVALMEAEMAALNRQILSLTTELEKESRLNAELRAANLKQAAEKEQVLNMFESIEKQNFELAADMKLKEHEKGELNSRARRLEAGVNRYREISDAAQEKILINEKKIKQLEQAIEERDIENIRLKEENAELQEVREKQFQEILQLEEQLDEGFSREVRKAPNSAPDPIKMAVEALIELSQSVRQEQLVADFGLERENLVCARNLIVAIKDSDYIQDVVNAANGLCADAMEYRTVAVEASMTEAFPQVITKQIIVPNTGAQREKPKEEVQWTIPQFGTPDNDPSAEEAFQTRIFDLNRIIDKLKRENMGLSTKCASFRKENEDLAKLVQKASAEEQAAHVELETCPNMLTPSVAEEEEEVENSDDLGLESGRSPRRSSTSQRKHLQSLENLSISLELSEGTEKAAAKVESRPRKSVRRERELNQITEHFSGQELRRGSVSLAVASFVKIDFEGDDLYEFSAENAELRSPIISEQVSMANLPRATSEALSAAEKALISKENDTYMKKLVKNTSKQNLETVSKTTGEIITGATEDSKQQWTTDEEQQSVESNGEALVMSHIERSLLAEMTILQEPNADEPEAKVVVKSFLSWLGYDCRLVGAELDDNTENQTQNSPNLQTILSEEGIKSSASLILKKPSHNYKIFDLMKFEDSSIFSATEADILDEMNEVVRSLPQEMRYDTKIDLNNVLFKHIDHELNKKNFAQFYEKYHEILWERSPNLHEADEELVRQVIKFIDYANMVKTVEKQEGARFEETEEDEIDLLDPRAPATSKEISNENKIIQRQERILSEFSVNSREVAQMSDLLFEKYLTDLKKQIFKRKDRINTDQLRREEYNTSVETEVAPTKSIEELKQQAHVEMHDFSINVDFLDSELLPFESEALELGHQMQEADDYINKALEQKVENFVVPREHKEEETEESAVNTDKTMQTDTAIDGFMEDAEILGDMKKMLTGDLNNFNVAYIKGMDDNDEAIVELNEEDLVPEAKAPTSLLARKIRYNNLVESSQVNSRAQEDLFSNAAGTRSETTVYVENTTIEDGIKDQVQALKRDAERLRGIKDRASTTENPNREGGLISSQAQSIHFQKGLEQSLTSSELQNSQIIPPIQQRNSVRQGHITSHRLDQTQIDGKYAISASKLIIDEDDIMRKLRSIESSIPSYEDFLRLVKTSETTNTSETAQTVLESNLEHHPRFGEYIRFSQKSIISPPINDCFVIQHPVDKVYLKYCPSDGAVIDSTIFYPALLENIDGLEQYYYSVTSDSAVHQTQQLQQIYELEQNTLKCFKYAIDAATFQQTHEPPPELRRLKTLMPENQSGIKYVRLSALTFSTNGYRPVILNILENIQLSPTHEIRLGEHQYIKIPIENVSLKSLNWTLKLVKTLVVDRMEESEEVLATTTSDTASTFVTAAADARKVRFTVVSGNLQRREAESVAYYFVSWAMKKYGVKTIVSQLAWNFIVNLVYYQYENAEIYLFARMFFEDLESDYFLFYLELRRVLNLRNRQENVTEMIATKTIPSVVATTLKNWEPKRQYAFVQNVFSVLYSKEEDDRFIVPTSMDFQQFCQLILFAFGMFRRTAYEQAGLVFNHLAKEQGTGSLLGEAGFRELCQVLIPEWSTNTVSEVFYVFSAGPSTTDLSQRRMAMANLEEMFISMQLGRFSGVSADVLEQTISIELKKLIKSSAFVFEQMAVVAKQIIQVMMRHAALKNGEKYVKYTKILKCYVDVIQCDIMAFDFVNALANMKLVLGTIIEGLLEIIPDACIVAIGGSMTALKNFFSLLM